jgi:hypothetical protein
MKFQTNFGLITLLLLTIISCNCANEVADVNSDKEWPIIKRRGDQLFEGDKSFRFLGFATPNIQQNESQLRKDMKNRFPDEYEIRDILSGLQRVGSRATRTFSLSVFSPEDDLPVYITSRRNYNEEAFKCLDRILAFAPEYDVRIIIPFIASQRFRGFRGVDEFAILSGKEEGSFWNDKEVKDDFKHFLQYILNRKNTISGVIYKNDPAILAWQLGNEFGSYYVDRGLEEEVWSPKILEWSQEMAAYIKTEDSNHLVMEAGGADKEAFIEDPNIDIISEHLYEYWNKQAGKPWRLAPFAREVRELCKGKKPLIIDEFGLGSNENLEELVQTIIDENIVGGLMWSMRGHRGDGGWYYHNEGGTSVNSFHVPGFSAGFAYEEERILKMMKKYAYEISDLPEQDTKPPYPKPVLIKKDEGFTWRGSAGAACYTMERSETENGPWKVIGVGLHDSVVADVVNFEHTEKASEPLILFFDGFKEKSKIYFYRIKGENTAGSTDYSNIVKVSATK